jgi:formylglycine-generating enzyme required for sulfatase activity
MRNNPSQRRGDNLPVENVSSEDCEACLAELNGMLKDKLPAGYRFALPTEAQWEYACRSGTATAFYYGDILDITRANFGEDFPLFRGGKDGYVEKTRPVKSYQPNDWGLYDMHGNVWEWCADWYSDKLLGGTDPTGPNTGSGRVVRGGSWDYGREWCRSAYRAWIAPDVRSARLGFRAAVSVA